MTFACGSEQALANAVHHAARTSVFQYSGAADYALTQPRVVVGTGSADATRGPAGYAFSETGSEMCGFAVVYREEAAARSARVLADPWAGFAEGDSATAAQVAARVGPAAVVPLAPDAPLVDRLMAPVYAHPVPFSIGGVILLGLAAWGGYAWWRRR